MPETDAKTEPGGLACPAESLRERKKEMTRRGIEKAVLELVVERGYENVTIDDVCDRASISRKTFFNYFASKDAAILGSRGTRLDEDGLYEMLVERAGEGNYLDALVTSLQMTWNENDGREGIVGLRREVLSEHPQIFFQAKIGLPDFQNKAYEALVRFLEDRPECRMLPESPVEEESLVAASAVINIARTRACLSIHGDRVPSAEETRQMVGMLISSGA